MTLEGYRAFSRAFSLDASLESEASARPDCLGDCEADNDEPAGGVFIGPLKAGKLVNEPSPVGMGIADEATGCSGGLEGWFVKESSCSNWTMSTLRHNTRTKRHTFACNVCC